MQSVLAVSRAVGDAALMPYITAKPDVISHTVSEDDLCVVTASDGVFDVMDNAAVAKFVVEQCNVSENDGKLDDDLLKYVGRKLCVEAGKLMSGDNVTAVVTSLQ